MRIGGWANPSIRDGSSGPHAHLEADCPNLYYLPEQSPLMRYPQSGHQTARDISSLESLRSAACFLNQ
jgi:hypothetical protein